MSIPIEPALPRLCTTMQGMPALPPADPFKASKRRDWRKRGSSGDWVKDRLLWQEEVAYKRALGLN